MNYIPSKEVLRNFYLENKIIDNFEKDNQYLESAFSEITDIWFENLDQIEEVKYLMIAEAPLWGKTKNYIYNPKTKFTQFFFKSDLEHLLNATIKDKADFVRRCNEIGLLIIDISPFALNPTDTTINYRTISKPQYLDLVKDTIPFFFEEKIKAISPKKSESIKVFFRYARVMQTFQELISSVLIKHDSIQNKNEISEISQQGGSIDRVKFERIIDPTI